MKYLIWSWEHNAWWRAERSGYTTHVAGAGRYSAEEAIEIICSCVERGEIPIREREARDDAWPAQQRSA